MIAGYLSYQSATDALFKQTTQQLGKLAEKTAQQIDLLFASAEKDINLLANYPFIQLAFLQFEFRQRLDTVQRLLTDYLQKHESFSNIYLVGLDGRAILAVPSGDLPTHPFHEEPWFVQTLKHGHHLSAAISPHAGSHGGIFLGKTVFDFENPQHPVGVLVFHIKPAAYVDYVRSLHLGSGGYAVLTHHGGSLIYHPDPRLRTVSEFTQNGDSRLEGHVQQMTRGETGYGRYSSGGEEAFLVYTACQKMPWSVGITILEAELMADVNRFQSRMQTFFLIIILLILPISYLFIKSVTRPIKQLIDGAKRIGSGDLEQTIRIESNDELSDVAHEFNRMAAQLKSSMREILDLKNFNEDILRNVTSGIITVDCRGQITSLNAGAQKILDHDTTTRRTQVTPQSLEPILDVLRHTLDSGQGEDSRELAIHRPGQDVTYVEVNTSMLSSMAGKVFGAIAEIRDITQRKQMEEMMLRVERLASLGELSAGLAHEIRNPLAGIKTSVQVLAKRVSKPESKQLLRGIESEINHLNQLVTDLLHFSRPAPPRPQPVDVTSILDATIDLTSEKIRAHHIVVERRFDDAEIEVVVDKEQIRQVFLNLLLNSIKSMEAGGRLTIEARRADSPTNGSTPSQDVPLPLSHFVEVIIGDTGRGIAPHDLPKVFDPFFTSDPSGTGLGLAIAHKLIEENGGTIFLTSVKEEGTRARLLLPTPHELRNHRP